MPEQNNWRSIAYGGGKFVAVAANGDNRIFTFEDPTGFQSASTLSYDEFNSKIVNDVQLERRYGVDPETTDLRSFGIYPLTEQPAYEVEGYAKEGDAYKPLRDYTVEIEEAQATIETLRSRLASIEADEVNDDATDTLLINTVADLIERVEQLEGGV